MARRQPRDSKGRFVKKSRSRSRTRSRSRSRSRSRGRKNPPRDSMGRFKSTSGRSRRRRSSSRGKSNPPRLDIVNRLTDGSIGAVQVTLGKVAVRDIPRRLGLPSTGAVGDAVQVAGAVLLGMATEQFLGRDAGEAVTIGGLCAPLERMLVERNVPVAAPALQLGRYPMPPKVSAGNGNGVGRYLPRGTTSSRRRGGVRGVGAYPYAFN